MLAVHSCCLSFHLQGNVLHKDLLLNFFKNWGKGDYLLAAWILFVTCLKKNTFFLSADPKRQSSPGTSPWRHLDRGITYHVDNQSVLSNLKIFCFLGGTGTSWSTALQCPQTRQCCLLITSLSFSWCRLLCLRANICSGVGTGWVLELFMRA